MAAGEGAVEAGAQDEPGRRDDRRGQRGPGQVPFRVGVLAGEARCVLGDRLARRRGRPRAPRRRALSAVYRPTARTPAPGRPAGRPVPRTARHTTAMRLRRSREPGTALSVGSIPVPLTAGGAHAPRPGARQPSTARVGKPFPVLREHEDAPTAAGHGRRTSQQRPQKASTGGGRRRLPECAPATRMHLVCAERVAFNRYSSAERATSAAASGPCSSRTPKPSSFRTGTFSCIALSYFDPGLSPTTTNHAFFETEPVTFAPRLPQGLLGAVAREVFEGARDDDGGGARPP
ncbi:hypothetical protein SVIOM74S_02061 [Streptomyces violarus]